MKTRLAAIVLVFAMVAVACGQKPGVHRKGVLSGEAPVGFGRATGGTGAPAATDPALGTTTTVDPTTGQTTTVDPTTGLTTTTDPTTGTTTTTGGSTGGSGSTGGNTGGTSGTTPSGGGGGDTTGVTAKEIIIGIHAPVTGAAPVRSDSFNTGRQLYWDKGNNGGPVLVNGRRVKVVFANDEYNPSTARTVCKNMAETQKAFLLVGGAGTDQIKACADYSKSKGIPYLSAGVTQDAIGNNPVYFALSMTYKQQAPLLASYIKNKLGLNNPKVAAIITDTGNFDDAANTFKAAYGANATLIRPSKSARGSQYADDVCDGPLKKFDVVFPLTSVTFFLELEGAAVCAPIYAGVGVSMAIDTAANLGCEGGMNAHFFSPWPGWQDTARNDPAFQKAGGKDDLEWALWGLSKTLHQLFLKAGPNLTRQGFIAAAEKASIAGDVFPDVAYSPGNHFGAKQVHVLKADCGPKKWVTEIRKASSF